MQKNIHFIIKIFIFASYILSLGGFYMDNIFILGPVASGKNALLNNIVKNHITISLDTGRIFRYVAYHLCDKLKNETNFEKICNNDEQEIKKVTEKIYHLTKFIGIQLKYLKFSGNKILENDREINIDYLYERRVNVLLPIIAKNLTIRNMITKYIDYNISSSDKPVIMTGHNIKEIDTTKFTVVFLDVEEKESAIRLYKRNANSYNNVLDAYEEVLRRNQTDKIKETKGILSFLYNYIYIDTNNKSEEEIYQEFTNKMIINKTKNVHFCSLQEKAIDRKKFKWMLNPIMEPLKKRLIKLTDSINSNYPYINQNDLIYQTLILLTSHEIFELYNNCSLEDFENVDDIITNRDQNLYNKFIEKVESGVIKVNDHILLEEIKSATIFLLNLYSSDFVKEFMAKSNLKARKSLLESQNGLMIVNNDINTNSNIIIFKKIDYNMSYFLSKYCHYLHTPREDELVAYGAFIDNEQYPIAYVSFSKQDREYKKQLLYNLGIEPQNTVEMTRAWCSNSAPQNIMSSLFQYSINEIAKKWKNDSKLGLTDKNLQAVTTTINPNLGFKASSFFGCNFIQMALRPAQFTFKMRNGIITYETRRKIIASNFEECYFENSFNILPLNELILCLDKNKNDIISRSKILLIDKEDYEKVLKGKKMVRKKEY